jgi:hypothetical protein
VNLLVLRASLLVVCFLAAQMAVAEDVTPQKRFRILDRIIAVVADEIILESEVDRLTGSQIISKKEGEPAEAYRERVLQELITDVLRERELRSTGGFEPDPREVEKQFDEIARSVEASEGRPYTEILGNAGVTVGEAKNWIKRGIALNTYMRDRLLPRIRISQQEVEEFYAGPFRDEAQGRGLEALPPLSDIQDQLVVLLRERRLNAEIERWTEGLRKKTRILIYRRPPKG